MTDVELLPLPEWTKRDDAGRNMVPSEIRVSMAAYAHAVAEHNVAAKDAENERLRAEVERLAEALREAYRQVRELCDCYGHAYPEASFDRYEAALQDKEGHND